jgi:hypothetical protein
MLSAAKKRRVTSSNSSFNSDDDGDPPAIRDITAIVAVSENNKSDFRVMYIVSFTKPCCDNHIKGKRVRIQICSETAFFWDGADTWSLMKEKTMNSLTAIGGHDRQYFNELRSTVVSCQIFIRSQSLIAR